MKYRIKVDYSTGNSFENYDTHDYVEFDWEDLDIVKQNLQCIKEHYEMYRDIEGYSSRGSTQLKLQNYQNEEWFVLRNQLAFIKDITKDDYQAVGKEEQSNGTIIDCTAATHSIKLKLDNGKYAQISCFWCGYFEQLMGAKIESDFSDMEFTIN